MFSLHAFCMWCQHSVEQLCVLRTTCTFYNISQVLSLPSALLAWRIHINHFTGQCHFSDQQKLPKSNTFLSGAEFTNIWDVCTIRYSGVQLNCAFSRTVIHDRFMYIIRVILNIILAEYLEVFLCALFMFTCSRTCRVLLCYYVVILFATCCAQWFW